MKRPWIILLIIGALLSGACSISGGGHTLRGSGTVESETREVSDFTRISIDGVGELHLVQGDTASLEIEADDNILRRIQTRVVNGELYIDYESGFWGWNILPSRPIRFYVTVPELEEMTINGGARILNEGWEGDELRLVVNGAADISWWNVSLNALDIRLEGGADCDISGQTGQLDLQVDGAGSVNLDDMQVTRASVTVNGVSDVRLWVTDSLDVDINGAGQVQYYGAAEVVSQIDGIGSVRKLGEK